MKSPILPGLIMALALLVTSAGLPLLQDAAASSTGAGARARMTDVAGKQVGTVTFSQRAQGVLVEVSLSRPDLVPDFHGFHLHQNGVCDPDDPAGPFMSAGDHFNPSGVSHGDHAGDMPSLLVLSDGSAQASFVTDRYTVTQILRADVAAIVHEGRDNFANIPNRYVSRRSGQPGPDAMTLADGDNGDRALCGVVESA